MRSLALRFVFITAALTLPASAQTVAPAPAPKLPPPSISTHPEWRAAKNPADVDTIEHLMASLYDVISGPAGQQRDWARFRSLFLPDGRMGVIRQDDAVLFTPDKYVERDDPYFKANGFFERAIANRIETFGNLTSVWSTYESRKTLSDKEPFARGINSLQIIHAQGRYWIASIMWDDERPGLTLPDKYLKQP